MGEEWPKFRVFAVKDGEAYGLLVKRQRSELGPEEAKYFWLRGADGLAPTQEVHAACNTCHALSSSVYNHRFVALLIGYTEAAIQMGCLHVALGIISKYRSVRDYQDVVDHFFERGDRELRDLFVKASIFKKKVLERARGTEELVGRAEEFRLLSPHDVGTIGSGYFKPIAHVLRVGYGKPEWSRREGPLAVDLDAGIVCRRHSHLARLRELVLANQTSLLEGVSATGKTVLVRQMGYELWLQDGLPVYWFDCAIERGFDKDRLINEINNARGVFIIENAHAETRKCQRICYSITRDPRRHVLFTARSSFRDTEDRSDWQLSKLDHIILPPFDKVGELLAHFIKRHPDGRWCMKRLQSILQVSGENLWLLSHALIGCAHAHAEGQPDGWVANEVRQGLMDLQIQDPQFPLALVALSPLYSSEVMTEETFLVSDIGIRQEAMENLAYRGEITRRIHDEEGHVLYGLPHSVLAALYWEYGGVYRRRGRLPTYEEFIYRYVVSGAPNGLDALNRALRGTAWRMHARSKTDEGLPNGTISRVHARLKKHGAILDVVEKETSLNSIGWWISQLGHVEQKRYLRTDRFLTAVIRKINACDDPLCISQFLYTICSIDPQAGRMLSQSVDRARLSRMLFRLQTPLEMCRCVSHLHHVDSSMTSELLAHVNIQELARKVIGPANAVDALRLMTAIAAIDGQKVYGIWQKIDKCEMASRMNSCDDLVNMIRELSGLWSVDAHTASMLWRLLDYRIVGAKLLSCTGWEPLTIAIRSLARRSGTAAHQLCDGLDLPGARKKMAEVKNMGDAVKCLSVISRVHRNAGRKLWAMVDIEELASELSNDVHQIPSIIDDVAAAHPDLACQLCDRIDFQVLLERLDKGASSVQISRCIAAITSVDPRRGREVFERLDFESLQHRLMRQNGTGWIASFLTTIQKNDRCMARAFCRRLDLPLLQECIAGSSDFLSIYECISAVYSVDPDVGRGLWKALDLNKLAAWLNSTHDFMSRQKCIVDLGKADPAAGRSLCRMVDPLEIAGDLMAWDSFVEFHSLATDLDAIRSLDREFAKQICDFRYLPNLAEKMSAARGRQIAAVPLCIRAIQRASPEAAYVLCTHLNVQQLSEGLRTSVSHRTATRCVNDVRQANSDVGRVLCDMLNVSSSGK